MYDVWSTSYPVPEKREEEAVEEGTFHVCFGLQNFCFIICMYIVYDSMEEGRRDD
uniref:Transmembrane protein n=1 Tax=Lepeophtheirus salmonis TaxID=72036 RepID=A0A0K2SWJ5_LEPSM